MDALDLSGQHTVAGRRLERRVVQEGRVSGCYQGLSVFGQLVDKQAAVGRVELGGDVVE